MNFSIRSLGKSAIVLVILTSGCAKMGEFPSLAKRPFETGGAPAANAPAITTTPDPALPARLAAITSKARSGETAFATNYNAALRTVSAAGGASAGSEAWIEAQLAISRLEPLRSPAQSALLSVDDESRRSEGSQSMIDRERIAAARADVSAIAEAQTAQVQQLLSRLRSR
jgi:hypothetical protein